MSTPADLQSQIAELQAQLARERAKTHPGTCAYIEYTPPGTGAPLRVDDPDSELLAEWRKRGFMVCYAEWREGVNTPIKMQQRPAERCYEMLRSYLARETKPSDLVTA